MSKRSFEILLDDMIESIDKIERYTVGLTFTNFIENEIVVDAVNRNFTIIGEAANRLPLEFTQTHSDIDWTNIISFRNRIVHEYFGIDSHIIWQIITNDLSDLKKQLQNILK